MAESEQKNKRLKVAVYNKEGKENSKELLGCMTFGVRHLMSRKKQVDGWYYLLSDDIGRRKHLQADKDEAKAACKAESRDVSRATSSLSNKSGSGSIIPEVYTSLQGLETITIVVKRGRQGYGFTVMSSSPVCIGKVEEGSHAETSGLKKGDAVVRINGQNVSRSTADSVAKIVKQSQKQIILDVVRTNENTKPSHASSVESVYETLTSSSMSSSYENLPFHSCRSIHSSKSQKSSSTRRSPANPTPRSVNDTLPLRPIQDENRPPSRRSRHLEDHHLSRSSKKSRKSQSSFKTDSNYSSLYISGTSDNVLDQTIDPLNNTLATSVLPWDENEEIYFPHNEEIYDQLPWKPFDCDLESRRSKKNDTYASMYDVHESKNIASKDNDELNRTMLSEAEYAHTTLPDLSVSFCDLSRQEKARQAALQHLILLEANFVSQMQFGIQRYSRPLRHCILSGKEHRTLFQNVEKLVAFSEYHLRQMTKSSQTYTDMSGSEDRYIDSVGSIYCPKVPITCDAYERYSEGLPSSTKLFNDLKTYEQFHEFCNSPQPSDNQPTIEEFLIKPPEHLQAIMLTLRTVLSHTPENHKDTEALRLVVEAFSNSLDAINSTHTEVEESLADESSMSFGSSGASSKESKSSSASLDSQVVELQERLVFPKGTSYFQLATPSRHVIYSGELLRVENCMWTRVYVVLLSDLLLVTKVEGDSLVVVDDPLPLPDIINMEFSCGHPCEFTLTAEVRSSVNASIEPRHILLRATTPEQHCTWKSLLDQRISSFRAHRELMTGRHPETMF